MNKTWLVIKHEYLKHVKKKRFILAIISLPFFVLLMVAIGYLSVVFQYNDAPVGYIDRSGLMDNSIVYQAEAPLGFMNPIEFIRYNDETEAESALNNETIQAFYVVDKNFIEAREIKVVANKAPDSGVNNEFFNFFKLNLLKNLPGEISDRIMEGADFEIKSTGDQKTTDKDNILVFILPFLAGFLFIMAVNISAGYLLQAVVEEKENRTMEIMVTSISPTQLMTAKVIGNLSVGLTQLVVWIIFGIIGIFSLFRLFPNLQSSNIDYSFLLLTILVFIPAFVMIAAMMAALGATTTETREAQQIAGIFTIPMVAPYWFMQVLMEKPNSPLSIFFSLFPFTAPVSLPMRAAFSNIPAWQIAITITLLILFAIAALWFAGKAFRLGMLRYGKKLSLKEIFTQRS
ncbi:MAG: ABC transporter permease [Anaerolineaceae bacterium]|nr:ABC transporter permease [Anaerolineaceae bacterium]